MFPIQDYSPNILETVQRGGYRTVTDLDILAVRFPGAGIVVPKASASSKSKWTVLPPDPLLGAVADRTDMIIGEVKEGRAEVNSAVRNPLALRTALARFGCCSPAQALELARRILQRGHALTDAGHSVTLVAFGSTTLQTMLPGTRPLH
jgi:hypothetical protein